MATTKSALAAVVAIGGLIQAGQAAVAAAESDFVRDILHSSFVQHLLDHL